MPDVLRTLATEADRTGEPLGLGPPERLRGWEHIRLHSLTYERLGEQMAAARKLGVPYILIMGHKEAVENAILVREVATNSQESVQLEDLPSYLKRRRMASVAV